MVTLTGIQDSFCAVAKELIEMFEENPNSGFNVLEGYSSHLASRNNTSTVNLRSNQQQSAEEETKTGICC